VRVHFTETHAAVEVIGTGVMIDSVGIELCYTSFSLGCFPLRGCGGVGWWGDVGWVDGV